ncbi:MAG: fumarate reductase subunit D [Candidatus Competibacteraceae bacterium]|jgi:fumarate reductase subunit D|uniref:Fumarate reductase subunit D n=1 Tax=Candidatus Competibacter phosphatis TaxID=221280 RepID=A0ABX1TIJ2_9GAMM|nr:fumarate reductase subunit FrdD [Candidatus Competibacter phosphatis]MCB1795206.1 fumarate reductase subunit D [Candidatus Competibacteraceae bacterium]MDG4561101.1 fumarate reductase subunit D [Candidatus Competibacter sp.]NMQ17924.1 fumarate reductase subunit D [Candidatus Competibacter phosphatis]QQS54839.1 MAG: fumarate reductase subunit D [Candidatus Competibacteraceae bacterium]HRW65779.1 fumarate reductase subunit D [Candidatus Competibacter sp.]
MAKSNKPIFWGLFAAGGTVTAFVTPVLVLITLFAAMRFSPALFTYEYLHAFAANWLGKLVIFGIILLSLWHAAHRLRVTVHDFGVRADTLVAYVVYGLAGLGTLLTIIYLLRI